jgi:hypothetical protein
MEGMEGKNQIIGKNKNPKTKKGKCNFYLPYPPPSIFF